MAKQQSSQDYVMGLEDNAFSSLAHGIEHYIAGSDTDLKFTVLHVFHAVELLLKARLAKAHPLLILQRPEDDPTTGLTADYRAILKRLKNLDVQLTVEDERNLDSLRITRNKIEHYEMQGNRRQIEDYVARAMKLLDGFVEKELQIRLRDRMRPELYRAMEQALYSYEERKKRVMQRIVQALPTKPKDLTMYRKLVCDECGEEEIYFPDPDSNGDTVQCLNCLTTFYYWICDSCGEPILSTKREYRDIDICDACWSNILAKD